MLGKPINIGYYNFVMSNHIIALIEYKIASSRNIVKDIKRDKPRNLLNLTMGRKAETLIVLTGDRYVISALPRKQLANRLDFTNVLTGLEVKQVRAVGRPKGSTKKHVEEVTDTRDQIKDASESSDN